MTAAISTALQAKRPLWLDTMALQLQPQLQRSSGVSPDDDLAEVGDDPEDKHVSPHKQDSMPACARTSTANHSAEPD